MVARCVRCRLLLLAVPNPYIKKKLSESKLSHVCAQIEYLQCESEMPISLISPRWPSE